MLGDRDKEHEHEHTYGWSVLARGAALSCDIHGQADELELEVTLQTGRNGGLGGVAW